MTAAEITRFNEREAVQHRYESLRTLRSLLPNLSGLNPLPDEVADDFDWQQAVRECQVVTAHGILMPDV